MGKFDSLTSEELIERKDDLERALSNSIELMKRRLEELAEYESRQNEFIESGVLSMLNQASSKIKATMKLSISHDFLLHRKIYTRNLFLLRERMRCMEKDIEIIRNILSPEDFANDDSSSSDVIDEPVAQTDEDYGDTTTQPELSEEQNPEQSEKTEEEAADEAVEEVAVSA